MYRLLGFKSVSNAKLLVNRRKITDSNQNFHLLLFNPRTSLFRLPAGRRQSYSSSGLKSEMLNPSTKNKKKKRYQSYIELLQVTETAKQTTTAIKKLKNKKLSDFIQNELPKQTVASPSLEYNKYQIDMHKEEESEVPILFIGNNVNELKLSKEGYQEIIESFNAYREITEEAQVVEETTEDVEHILEEEAGLVPDLIPVQKPRKEAKVKTRFKGKYHKTAELENLSRQKSLSLSLRAYLDCCVTNGMLNRGYLTILNYRSKFKRNTNGIKIVDVRLYNVLIHGYAEKENLTKVNEIMNILREDEIAPNEQTYANYLECLARLVKSPKAMEKHRMESEQDVIDAVKNTFAEAEKHGFTVNSLIDQSVFLRDQREIILQVIRLVLPDFEPAYTQPELCYDNPILNALNENVNDITFNPLKHLDEPQVGREIMNSKEGFSREKLEAFGRQQLETELAGYFTIKSIQEFPTPTASVIHCREKIEELQKSWRDSIIMSFYRDLNTMRHQETTKARGNQNLLPYLRALEVDDYASIVLREIRFLAEGSETYSPTVSQLYRALGNKVQLRYQMEHKKRNGVLQKTGEIYGNYCDILAAGNTSDNPRQCWQRLVYQRSNDGPSMNFIEKSWPIAAQIGVGRFLYNIMMRDLRIDINCLRKMKQKADNMTPALYTLFRNQGRMVKEEVKPHPVLVKLFRNSQQETLTFDVNHVPMICPPLPWTTSRSGGYLLAKSDLIRLPQTAHQQLDRINNTPLPQLYPALDSLNQLASVPWTVNEDVLDVVLKVFNAGGNDKLDVPPLPSTLPAPVMPDIDANLTKAQKFDMYRKKMAHRRKQAEMYSLWCDALYRLSLANHFRKRVFWLPHNMDFRGRVYPVPPHLNHLGSDLARSLLVFHQKKKLGVDGFSWLKLHCINLTGLKKRDSVRERLLYVEAVMEDILDSADNPLDGRMWWTKSDEPWQTLSCCVEIAKVLRSGDPENYESSFPIHQDGSCNGLQHYAALGRDAAGAYSVNLAPADVPQDVYSGIATLVEQARLRDEENGMEVAKVLRNFVRRKVIKQTVMTTVYGVTKYGARLQMAKQLKDIDDFPKEWVWPASTYLTTKTFDSLREMFQSTKEIQDWFTDCARQISSVCGQNVEWTTPLGLPVVQPYNRQDRLKPIISKSMKLDQTFNIDTYSKPNIMKQKNAFPPNFIHSLDSSHMMLTSLLCEKQGLTFISVHDCFWTHACTVPEMNRICREQFVALHSEQILEDLSASLVEKYSFSTKDFQNDGSVTDMSKLKLNRVLTMVPKKGDFNLLNVLKSIYFFS